MTSDLMTEEAHDVFVRVASETPASAMEHLDDVVALMVSRAPTWARSVDYDEPAKQTEAHLSTLFSSGHVNPREMPAYLLAKLAAKTPDLVAAQNLPRSILEKFPAVFDRMARDLEGATGDGGDRREGLLWTYARFVLAMSVPAGAQVIDLVSHVPLKSALLSVPRSGSLGALTRYLGCGGTGVWFRDHTDREDLSEFNEEGWDRYYVRVAELLLRRPEIRGLVGTSWFYDPKVAVISPRLAYLQHRPLERGAFLMKHRSNQYDIDQATLTSKTRRGKYEDGSYLPTSYSLLWARNELIAWAETVSSAPLAS